MEDDALWYEAAFVVGITNALNVVADGLTAARALGAAIPDPDEANAPAEARGHLRRDPRILRAGRRAGRVPPARRRSRLSRRRVGRDAARVLRQPPLAAAEGSARVRRVAHHALRRSAPRSTTARCAGSASATRGVMEVLGVTQMFSSYTKIADTLQLEPDMGDIAPADDRRRPRSRTCAGAAHVRRGERDRSALAAPLTPAPLRPCSDACYFHLSADEHLDRCG